MARRREQYSPVLRQVVRAGPRILQIRVHMYRHLRRLTARAARLTAEIFIQLRQPIFAARVHHPLPDHGRGNAWVRVEALTQAVQRTE